MKLRKMKRSLAGATENTTEVAIDETNLTVYFAVM